MNDAKSLRQFQDLLLEPLARYIVFTFYVLKVSFSKYKGDMITHKNISHFPRIQF